MKLILALTLVVALMPALPASAEDNCTIQVRDGYSSDDPGRDIIGIAMRAVRETARKQAKKQCGCDRIAQTDDYDSETLILKQGVNGYGEFYAHADLAGTYVCYRDPLPGVQ
jgi:hypothetical protein